MSLRVGVNAVFMTPFRGGIATWTLEHIGAMRRVAPEVELVLFVTRATAAYIRETYSWAEEVEICALPSPPGLRAASRLAAELGALPVLARRRDLDVLHSVANLGPIRPTVPHIVTVHDLMYMQFPAMHPGVPGMALRYVVARSARRADVIVTPSEASRDAVVELLAIPRGRIEVIPMGPGQPRTAASDWDPRRELDLGDRRVVLTVGAGFEHKNVGRLIEAFARVGPQRGAVLVHVGPLIVQGREWVRRSAELQLDPHVRWASEEGFVTDERLEALFDIAEVLVHPAISEGFGMLPLEAMTRGVPVASSRAGALQEVAGDAAEYFDADDVEEMAAALATLLDVEARRQELIALGAQRRELFSWDRTARAYAELYRRLAV